MSGDPTPSGRRLACLTLCLISLVTTVCSSVEIPPDARRVAEQFCELYIERADARAALALASGHAVESLESEIQLLENVPRPEPPVARASLVSAELDPASGVVHFIAAVHRPDDSNGVSELPLASLALQLELVDGVWKVTGWRIL